MKLLTSKSRWIIAGVVVAIGVSATGFFFARRTSHRQDERFTESCANHAIQLKFEINLFSGRADRFPIESDTRKALIEICLPDNRTAPWLNSFASVCPESFKRNQSIGFVFVADGLSTKVVTDYSALVLFCPAENHQRSSQHCHAITGMGEMACLKSNAEMISLLQSEIARAKTGTVPYSTNALAKMSRELAKREDYERKRRGSN
jgi:hypothetical protein